MNRLRLNRTPDRCAYMIPDERGDYVPWSEANARITALETALAAAKAEGEERAKQLAELRAEGVSALAAMTAERDAQAAALSFVGGAVRITRAHVWTEKPGVEVQVFPDADVPRALRLVVRDVHAKKDLASVRVESFRLDLLCGPIVRLWLEYQAKIARAAVEGER